MTIARFTNLGRGSFGSGLHCIQRFPWCSLQRLSVQGFGKELVLSETFPVLKNLESVPESAVFKSRT